jgi:hypothetical protein
LFFLELLGFAHRLAGLDLGAKNRKEPFVLPGLEDEVTHASAHRFDCELDAPPGGHHHDRQRAIDGLDAREEIEPFLTGRRVSRVIEVHQKKIEILGLQGLDHIVGRCDGFGLIAFAF